MSNAKHPQLITQFGFFPMRWSMHAVPATRVQQGQPVITLQVQCISCESLIVMPL